MCNKECNLNSIENRPCQYNDNDVCVKPIVVGEIVVDVYDKEIKDYIGSV